MDRLPWNETIYLRLTGSFPTCIVQLQETFRRRGELDVELDLQESILVLFIQLGLNEEVLNATLDWYSKEGNISKDSCRVDLDYARNWPRGN